MPFFGVLVVSLVTVICGLLSSVVTVFSPSPVMSFPPGSLPVAVAWFSTLPAMMSFSVTVYVVFFVTVSPGLMLPSVQSSPVRESSSFTPLIVTFPLFVTVMVYVILSPSFTSPVLSDVLITVNPGFGVSTGSSFSPGVTGVSSFFGSGFSASPVALLTTFPAITSASVTT